MGDHCGSCLISQHEACTGALLTVPGKACACVCPHLDLTDVDCTCPPDLPRGAPHANECAFGVVLAREAVERCDVDAEGWCDTHAQPSEACRA